MYCQKMSVLVLHHWCFLSVSFDIHYPSLGRRPLVGMVIADELSGDSSHSNIFFHYVADNDLVAGFRVSVNKRCR